MTLRKSKKEVQKQLDEYFHGNLVILTPDSDFKGVSNPKTKVKCLTCGYEWCSKTCSIVNRAKQILKQGKSLNNGCIKCNKKMRGIKNRYTKNQIIQTINKYTHRIKVEENPNYAGKYPTIKLRCVDCGHEWNVNISSYLYYLKQSPWRDCPNCNIKKKHENLKYDLSIIKDIIKRDGVILIDIVGYNQKTRFMTIKCLNCGNIFKKQYQPNQTKRIISLKCPNCHLTESSGEYTVRKFLQFNNIKYKKEYLFYNDISKSNQRLDYFLPEFNQAIEIMGEQHYITTNGFYSERMNFLDYAKYKWSVKNEIKILYVNYRSSITQQLIGLLPNTKIPPKNYFKYDQVYNHIIKYLWEGHSLKETKQQFKLGEKPITRFIRMAGYQNYRDLKNHVLQKRNNFNYNDLIKWLKHHHANTLQNRFGITLKYVTRHIFNNEQYPYKCLLDIKNEAIKSIELTEYRKNHSKRDTAKYFLTSCEYIDSMLGTNKW